MGDSGGVSEDEIIDWEHLLDDMPEEDMNLFQVDLPLILSDSSSSVKHLSNPSSDSVSSWIGEIEHLLMKDDDDNHILNIHNQVVVDPNHQFCNDFLSDILVDSPGQADPSGEVVDASNDKSSNFPDKDDKIDVPEKDNDDDDDDDDDDQISKKRKRQLRNRDAAVRSRERKKMYVKDLEMKSRYLEGECRRLGRLLQCCSAENQVLRLSLQNGASVTKQESAVLLLESLLLGSLLWFLGIMCLLPLPILLRSALEAVSLENVDYKDQESLALRRPGSKTSGFWVLKSFIMSKRCKSSKTKMKPSSLIYEVLG